MDLQQALNWRYATKQFDATQKLSEEQISALMQETILSASSFGLQPYEFLIITDPAVRERLKAAAWNQSQITDASHLIVIAARTDVDEHLVEQFITKTADKRGISKDSLKGYQDMINGALSYMDSSTRLTWTQKQAYIALGTLLVSAATKEIDSCPMEGFNAKEFDEILGLHDKNLTATVLVPVGVRSKEDAYADYAKVRWNAEDIVHTV